MKKVNRFMELFWLVLAGVTLALAIWAIAANGFAQGRVWLWFPVVAVGMWAVRRFMRKKIEAMEERERNGTVPR